MLKWLKELFTGTSVPEVVNDTIPAQPLETPVKRTKAKITATKKSAKSGTCDFNKLTKAQLLKEAKHRGIKANASLTKAEILERVKNG